MKLHELVSPLFANHFLDRFGIVDLTETKATCDDCFCSKPNGQTHAKECSSKTVINNYSPTLKCCTFHPFLPNYAVGAILSDPKTPGFVAEQLLKKINLKEYALPLGIFPPVKFQVDFNNRSEADFGNKTEFLCAYYDKQKNSCGVWLHRGSVCTSYYCISDHGESGLQLWEMLGDYIHKLEMSLAQDCLVAQGIPFDRVENQFEYINCSSATPEEMKSNSMSQAIFESYWLDIEKDPKEFYISIYEYANSLDLLQFRSLLDEDIEDEAIEIQKLIKEMV